MKRMSKENIQRMFDDFGLGTESDRYRFNSFDLKADHTQKIKLFTRLSFSTEEVDKDQEE